MLKSIVAWLMAGVAAAALAAPKPPPKPAKAPLALVGKATQVIDGSTFVLETNDGLSLRVRLAGIEAPELCQTWGAEARDALKDWLQDQPLSVKNVGKDGKGSMLGQVVVDGADINRRMVEEGHAFSQRTKWDRGPYVKEERVAHSLTRGMYSVGVPENPAEFKRSHGPCK